MHGVAPYSTRPFLKSSICLDPHRWLILSTYVTLPLCFFGAPLGLSSAREVFVALPTTRPTYVVRGVSMLIVFEELSPIRRKSGAGLFGREADVLELPVLGLTTKSDAE